MKAYFALSYSPISEMNAWDIDTLPDILTSYYVIGEMKKDSIYKAFGNRNAFLDSGAFTAFTKQIDINIDDYINFINQTKDIWNTYATLDVIGDHQATRANTEYMESQGLKPLPVFHNGSPEAELKRLVKTYDYIALGGLVPLALNRPKMQAWLDYCFSIIGTKTKVHGFGVNALWAWKRYPFYSVDATSWNQGMRYGRVLKATGLQGKIHKGNLGEYYNKAHGWKHRTELNIQAYKDLAVNITKLWESRGVKWN